ncbi:hypothetical protein NDU88_006080 [Pleurodeles waltl]|uniref:Uncharacterized protein n=1 Tax=Pleurodeles waltl TaxID=8319 RepID=A0AAV7PJX2_PLEWA|nr:hypothetical protein NDU88_006080 [Pleurodeles waltl]
MRDILMHLLRGVSRAQDFRGCRGRGHRPAQSYWGLHECEHNFRGGSRPSSRDRMCRSTGLPRSDHPGEGSSMRAEGLRGRTRGEKPPGSMHCGAAPMEEAACLPLEGRRLHLYSASGEASGSPPGSGGYPARHVLLPVCGVFT